MTPAAPHPHARWALASLALTMLMPSLDTSIANVGLPTIARAFGASFQGAQWIVLSYLLAITALIVGVGRLGDVVGRRRLLLAGIATFTAASLLCGIAPTLWALDAARAAQGLGAATMMALTVALVSETVPAERTGRAMGLLGTMSAVGTTLGPSLGGLLIAGLGWRALFLVNVPIGVANLVMARRFLPADRQVPDADRPRYDVAGGALFAATLLAYALAMTLGRGRMGAMNAALLALAAAGAALFVLVERSAAAPLLGAAALRDRALRSGLGASALVSAVLMATLVVGPFHLARGLGLPPAAVGVAMSLGPLVAALAGVPAGRLVDRVGARAATLGGLAGMSAGLALVVALPRALGVAGYVGPIMVVTAHYALFQAGNNTGLMTRVRADQRGVVSGLLSLARNLGLVTGVSALGALFAWAAGDVTTADPAAVAAAMRVTFAAAAALTAAGLGALLATPTPRPLAT